VTFARGFRAAGATGGIKASGRPDVALVVADSVATAAGAFTRSATAGHPVVLSRAHLQASGGRARAVVVSSGNANVATGSQGRADAQAMADAVALAVGARAHEVLVCSTGVIGVPLPMDAVRRGIAACAVRLTGDGGADAAEAILTTDNGPKVVERELAIGGATVRIGGIAKGAGMIRPDLGTMIAVITTDAAVAPGPLQAATLAAARRSFNRITVDGCQSTSDSLLVLAGGASGVEVSSAEQGAFDEALAEVCLELALMIVRDGEGARRVGRYEVVGARTDADAEVAARAVAEAQLVRCALHGADPNWGRIVAELGVCGALVDGDRIAIAVGGVPLVADGVAVAGRAAAAAEQAAAAEVHVRVDLGLGTGSATIWGSDLSAAYVACNAEYTT
jgi:glutamate N-acetyltransferase/amino-acid N-acetyltransferase